MRFTFYICDTIKSNFRIMEKLDVTKIEPRFKHSTIFEKYENLTVGESFILYNDHDPIPLYYQLTAQMLKAGQPKYVGIFFS